MPHVDLSLPNPADPANLDPADPLDPPPHSNLARHPYVRRLRREIARLREREKSLIAIQREMIGRSLIVGRQLEPVNPAPIGVIAPIGGEPTIVHLDNLRLLSNRIRGEDAPTIRLLVGGLTAKPQHCHWLKLGESELRERPVPLPGRSAAFVVLHTYAPVTVMK